MKVLINVANMSSAGGLSVGLGVVGSISAHPADMYFDIIIPSYKLYNFKSSQQVRFWEVPRFFRRFPGNLFLSLYLSYITKKTNPDKIFSMGNIPIASYTDQLVMIHWPYLVYQEHSVWEKMSRKEKLIRKLKIKVILSRIKYVKNFTVQTDIMKERLSKIAGAGKNIYVVPSNFAPLKEGGEIPDKIKNLSKEPGTKFFLYLTQYYIHKNLEVLIPLAKILLLKNKNYKLIVTISGSHSPGAKQFLETVKEEKLEDIIINVGPVAHKNLKSLYQSCDAFIMPSLLETVGLTYFEAMSEGLPVFTSSLDFAKDICKEAGNYFDPLNAEDIYNCIENAYADEGILQKKIMKGYELSALLPDWNTITGKYLDILKNS